MNARYFRFLSYLLAAVVVSVTAQADKWGPTAWESTQESGASVIGVVKTVAHDDAKDRYIVKVKTASGIETVMICFEGIQSARHQGNVNLQVRNPHLQTVYDSQSKGKRVKVVYGGTWDRCAKSVVMEPESKKPEQASASQNSKSI